MKWIVAPEDTGYESSLARTVDISASMGNSPTTKAMLIVCVLCSCIGQCRCVSQVCARAPALMEDAPPVFDRLPVMAN